MDAEMQDTSGGRRLVVHYALLIAVTAAVMIFVFTSGTSKHAQKQIAGGYDVSAAAVCRGPRWNWRSRASS